MKLELLSLRAVNCGPLKDVVIDFSDGNGHARPVTLLAGANGSGKTTVLELIAALAELLRLKTRSTRMLIDEQEPRHPKPDNILSRVEYARVNMMVDGRGFTVAFGNKPHDEVFEPDWFHLSNNDKTFWYQISKGGYLWQDVQDKLLQQNDTGITFSGISSKTEYIDDSMPSIIFFPHSRRLKKLQGTELAQADNKYEWVSRWNQPTTFRNSLESYLIWMEYSEPDTFNAIKEVVSTLFPLKKSLAIDRRRLKVVIDLQDGGRHDIDELSSGEQNLLIALIELRRRLLLNSIVLFDEIENSLHPAFQHRMAQGLLQLQREIPFQLIVTSHAEAFIDVFGTAATRILPMPNYASK